MKMAAIKSEVAIAGAVLLFGLVFAAYTQHAWEDYWITFRSSRNLATGHGLVYTSGERLHTFTSPLGVLLPAAFCWLTGNQSDFLVLWLFRVVSAGALATGVVLFFQTLQSMQLRRVSCWLTVVLISLDAKTLDFAINGMETGLLIFFLALAIHGLLVAGPRQMFRIGVGWAGLMWSRPDSCVYIAILGAGTWLFLAGKKAGTSRIDRGKTLLAAGLVCAVLYLPWFLWSWWYYGSPIPHTIIAKALNRRPILFDDLVASLVIFPMRMFIPLGSNMHFAFLPAYLLQFGGWPASLIAANYGLGLPAVFAWLVPGVRRQTRFFSLAFFLGSYFIYFITVVLNCFSPWYLPPVAVFGYLTIGCLFDQGLCLAMRFPRVSWFSCLPKLLRWSAVGLAIAQLAVTVCVARQLQVQQELIENGLRRPIGLWLRDHARTSRDTVMLEPLGYIGYYSGLKMLDIPGLASREMVEARRRLGPHRENKVGLELKPDWLVLRPGEYQGEALIDMENLQKFYDLVRVFDATDKINATRWLPGRPYLQVDQTFLVFHRKPDANINPPASGTGK